MDNDRLTATMPPASCLFQDYKTRYVAKVLINIDSAFLEGRGRMYYSTNVSTRDFWGGVATTPSRPTPHRLGMSCYQASSPCGALR